MLIEWGQTATDGVESVFVRVDGTDQQSELFSGNCGATTADRKVVHRFSNDVLNRASIGEPKTRACVNYEVPPQMSSANVLQ